MTKEDLGPGDDATGLPRGTGGGRWTEKESSGTYQGTGVLVTRTGCRVQSKWIHKDFHGLRGRDLYDQVYVHAKGPTVVLTKTRHGKRLLIWTSYVRFEVPDRGRMERSGQRVSDLRFVH